MGRFLPGRFWGRCLFERCLLAGRCLLHVCVLPLLLAAVFCCTSCSIRTYGDPVLNAWTEACGESGRIDLSGLPQFHDELLAYTASPEFILKAQDVPELRGVVEQMLELSAAGPAGPASPAGAKGSAGAAGSAGTTGSAKAAYAADAADAAEVGTAMGLLLLRYGKLASLSSERTSHVIILILLLLSFFSGMFIVFMILFLIQQRHFAGLRRKAEIEKAVSTATIRMQEDERSRIYRELHDTIAQDSRSALFALQNLHRHIDGDPDAQTLYERIERLEAANIENVRSVIRNIIPPDLLGDFRTVLLEWASNVSHSTPGGPECSLSIREDADFTGLSQEQRLHLFRIMQEAVGNASRHSGADEISVLVRGGTLPGGGRSLVLIVSDDGKGFDPSALPAAGSGAAGSATGASGTEAGASAAGTAVRGDSIGHYGIRGMRSRAELLGASFRIQSEPGEGCEVFVEIPLNGGGNKEDTSS